MRESTNFFSGHRYEKKKENAFFGVDASFAICVICVEFLGLKVSNAKKCFSGFGQSGMRSSWTHALAIYSRDKDRKMGEIPLRVRVGGKKELLSPSQGPVKKS